METQEILKIKSDLINEIIGQVAARGYYDIDGKVRFMYVYRGKGYSRADCTMPCNQETAMIDLSGTYFRAPVTKLYFAAWACELMVESNTAFCKARELPIDDLAEIRDLVCSITDEHIAACKDYVENEFEEFDEDDFLGGKSWSELSEHDKGVVADLEFPWDYGKHFD